MYKRYYIITVLLAYSFSYRIDMAKLCSEIHLMYPYEYVKTDDKFSENNEFENVLLKMPRKYKSVKTIGAKRCNITKMDPNIKIFSQ